VTATGERRSVNMVSAVSPPRAAALPGHGRRILFSLPPYAPQLNPDEDENDAQQLHPMPDSTSSSLTSAGSSQALDKIVAEEEPISRHSCSSSPLPDAERSSRLRHPGKYLIGRAGFVWIRVVRPASTARVGPPRTVMY
jgi:hypothetical protein